MTVAWLMFMPKDQAEKAMKLSSRKAAHPSRSGP